MSSLPLSFSERAHSENPLPVQKGPGAQSNLRLGELALAKELGAFNLP